MIYDVWKQKTDDVANYLQCGISTLKIHGFIQNATVCSNCCMKMGF